MRLDRFDNSDFDRGRPAWVEALWLIVAGLLFSTWLPGSGWRCALLRLFGAELGEGVVIKPRVRVKFPWRLEVGDHCWIGESAWIDNLAPVTLGDHCCLSQGVYLCTGNHRWDKETFDLETRPIRLEDHCWAGARATLMPGTVLREGAVIAAGLTVSGEHEAWKVYTEKGERPRVVES